MQNILTLGFFIIFILLGGCAAHSPTTNDEQVDLFLSTLDDKHFVWCELDLEQCRNDFEEWKNTARGRMIIREFEQKDNGQTYNTHYLPNVFRTHFVDESQFAEEMGGAQGRRQGFSQDSKGYVRSFPFIDENGNATQEEIIVSPRIYGPQQAP
ncbi:MAG: hypothetical protein P8X46_05665 [Nitrospirales bacterium]